MAKLRVALTISGAVALGAYEGGVLGALLLTVQQLGGDLVVDVIAGASAGAMTGLVSACALLSGLDPVDLMRKAWVEMDSLQAMLKERDMTSPLAASVPREIADRLLDPKALVAPPGTYRQAEPIRLSMALTNLNGLSYRIPALGSDPIPAMTYLDWTSATIRRDDQPTVYLDLAQSALASGANAMGFPPRFLDRRAERGAYHDAGMHDLPSSGGFWYSDGGTIDNEPLGRTLDLVNSIETDDPRMFVLVHPHPTFQPADSPWSSTAEQPTWLGTARRCASIARNQSIYNDLLKIQKVNTRLAWSRAIVDAVAAFLDDTADPAVSQALAAKLSDALKQVHAQHNQLRAQQGRAAHADPPEMASKEAATVLRALLERATGLEGKDRVEVEVISPLISTPPGGSVEDQLAGEFLFHFGGFFDQRFRESDFLLGYDNTVEWMRTALASAVGGPALDDALRTVVARLTALRQEWGPLDEGKASAKTLKLREKVELVELAAHTAHIVEHDLRKI